MPNLQTSNLNQIRGELREVQQDEEATARELRPWRSFGLEVRFALYKNQAVNSRSHSKATHPLNESDVPNSQHILLGLQ